MSWEIQGRVVTADDIDSLLAAPTEMPSAAESGQVGAVAAALKDIVAAGVVQGDVYVRAGGNANPGGGPQEGCAHEMLTLTIDWAPPLEVPEEDAVADDTAEAPAAPTEG